MEFQPLGARSPPPPSAIFFFIFFKGEEDGCAHGNAEKTVPFSSGGFRDFHSDHEICSTHEGDGKGMQNFSWKTVRGERPFLRSNLT